jgi:hypothetical protein
MPGIEPNSARRVDALTGLDFTTYRNCINGVLVDTNEHRHGIVRLDSIDYLCKECMPFIYMKDSVEYYM